MLGLYVEFNPARVAAVGILALGLALGWTEFMALIAAGGIPALQGG